MAYKLICQEGNDNLITIGDLYMFMGRSKLALNENEEALHYFLKGTELAPHFRENYLYAAKIYLNKGEYDKVVSIVNDALLKSRRYYS